MQIADQARRLPLHWQILLSSSAVLIVLIVSMLVYVNFQANRFVTARIQSDLVEGRARIESTVSDQLATLSMTARLVASIPTVKALLDTDQPTIKDFLVTYQHENRGPDLLIVLDRTGRVLARTDSDRTEFFESEWVKPALSGQPALGTLATNDSLYNAAGLPAEAAGTVFGFVLAGTRIDNAFARRLRDVSQDEVVILGPDRVVGSTLPIPVLPWQSRAAWESQTGRSAGRREVRIAGEAYAALPATLSYPGGPLIICLQSDDKALAPYRRIQGGLLLLGLLATSVGIAGSAMLARQLTAPIAELVLGTREVAAGNFDFRIKVSRGDEIGHLAESFNTMTEGLRQRADMQKFVSQSTLEAIQSSRYHRILSSERKVLTVFFSDIRGFTALSERRRPEHVVEILNRVFSLQTESIKKFSGDIDKFIGDAVLALFHGEDSALRAIRCAVEIHRAMDAHNAEQSGREPIHLGIGIATGEVILGSIGSEDRRDFTVIGSHVNLCARLCSLAHPQEILLAESTYMLVKDLIAAERLAPQHVKGFSDPVPVYRMTPRSV